MKTEKNNTLKASVRMRRIRYWLVSKLLNKDEKYLVVMALDSRVECLFRNRVEYRSMDMHDVDTDIKDYRTLRNVFSTDIWR